jgi:opacity protein-like surface antigen
VVNTAGVATEWEDNRQNGYYIGGGLDWKLARNVVVGIEYRHTDLGTGPNEPDFNPANGAFVEHVKQRAESDAVMVRGSLLFGGRDYAPLK